MGKDRIYILIYFLIFIIPLILLMIIEGFEFSSLWNHLSYYVFYLLIGSPIIIFGKPKARNLILLFQIGVSMVWLLRLFGLPLSYHDVEVYRFINILVFSLLFYIWYFFFHYLVKIRDIFFVLFIAVLSVLFMNVLGSTYVFHLPLSITTHIGVVVDTIVIIVGLLLGALLSFMKSKLEIIITTIVSLVIAFIVAINIGILITNLLFYGSFTGKTEIPVSFRMQDREGVVLTQKDINEKYKVAYVLEFGARRYYDLQKLECYYWKYRGNKQVCFYVAIVCEDEKIEKQDLFEKYESYNLSMPFYMILDPTDLRNQIGDYREKKIVCVLRNDTVIYRNEMSKAGEYLDD